jgi:hypothetical protein
MGRRVVVLVALCCIAAATAGCSNSVPLAPANARPDSATTLLTGVEIAARPSPDATVVVVRVIERAFYCASPPDGGPLVFIATLPDGDEEARLLASWESTAFVALAKSALPWPSAAADGVFVCGPRGVTYTAYDGSPSRTLDLGRPRRVWASPSGQRLLVERDRGRSSYALIDRGNGAAETAWEPLGGSVADAHWVSENELLVQAHDIPPDSGNVYTVMVSADRTTAQRKLISDAQCPSADSSGRVWAYGTGSGELVLYDSVAKREVLRYRPPGFLASPPAWCDSTHLALGLSGNRPTVVVLDVSRVMP